MLLDTGFRRHDKGTGLIGLCKGLIAAESSLDIYSWPLVLTGAR
jgi:hypothetical protein